ncbi:MAG: RluA family pseudouridine synthase [Clostridiales bacterium]|nr:RluA family pseudouridine synthase [Clostridiales bacterium]
MKKIEIVAKKTDRLLKILEKQCSEVNYSAFSSALRKKDILVDGVRQKENIVVAQGSNVCAYVPDNALKKDLFEIVYEDDNVLFVNKGKGIETCDGDFNVELELSKQGKNVYAVHRLDRNTLGLVIFAKTPNAQKELISEFKKGNVEKFYYAEVCGNLEQTHKVLHGYLVKNKEESNVKVFTNKQPNSQEIVTEYTVLKNSGNVGLLSVKIKDGKTHQIRAHLAYNKIYIIGDGKYGKNEINSKFKAKTQHLKAYKIIFNISKNSYLYYLNELKIELNANF